MPKKFNDKPIPANSGIGLRYPHYDYVLENLGNIPDIFWFEVHSENFFGQGGVSLHILEQVREYYPLSFHGVGLSLGTVGGIDKTHLKKLKNLVDHFNPGLVSEHVSWSNTDNITINDLLPLPYTNEALEVLVSNIKQTQDYLGRQILVENPSTYLEFSSSDMHEYEFMNKVADKSGCGILFDVNNIYVTQQNHGLDAEEYINNIDHTKIQEIHLAGHAVKEIQGKEILIDHHGDYIVEPVWNLYKKTIKKTGPIATLIEWDTDIPAFSQLAGEARKAEEILQNNR